MSFRLRIVLMTTLLISLLFSVGGTMLIHTSFQNSLEKEEETLVNANEMILRMVKYVGQDENWISEEKLISIIENLYQQDATHIIRLQHNGETIYSYQNGASVLNEMNQLSELEENYIHITYFEAELQENYVQSTMQFSINQKTYYLDIARSLTRIYQTRKEQIQMFQNIFLLLSVVGIFLTWGFSVFITRHLRKLTKATKEIARGNLAYRAKIKSHDEVGALGNAFDYMAESLEENITLLKESAKQKEMFIGAFTHELKTPMTSIIGYADLLRTQKLSKKDQADALDYIFSEGKRLENMSLKMLDLFVADKKELDLKWCSPAKIVAYTVRHLENVFQASNIQMEVYAEEGNCMLETDLFQTLLINLLDNARKAMEQGGKVTIRVKLTENGCVLTVADEGKGIPKESLKHLTEAFYRVDKARARSKGSAGLGLALCEKIVELHHGKMLFESEEGVGTEVLVYLNGGLQNEHKE